MVGIAENLPQALRDLLQAAGPVAVAFSGGLDSRFLCHAALLCNCDILAVHASGPHIPANETAYARAFAKKCGLPLEIVEYDPLKNEIVGQNGKDRCYHCKMALFSKLEVPGRKLVDGTNADDLRCYRPGLRAINELGVFSPLARAGLGKEDIRKLAAAIGLENPGQNARPCLLTRFAYHTRPDYHTLENLARAENELLEIFGQENDFRLRLAPEPVLQTRALAEKFKSPVDQIMKKYGFSSYKIIVDKTISGFFDRQDESIFSESGLL